MGSKSRNKGSSGELAVARILSAWWTGDDFYLEAAASDCPIRRTPGSGGWAKGKGISGDIVSVREDCNDLSMFSFEVKNREDWSFESILTSSDKWPLNVYWLQCVGDAVQADAWPFLIFTKNRHPWYFRLRLKHWNHLKGVVIKRTKNNLKGLPSVMKYDGSVYGLLEDFVSYFRKNDCIKAKKVTW